MIFFAFRIKISLFKPKPKLQAFEIAIIKKSNFKSFNLKKLSVKCYRNHLSIAQFVASIYLECFNRLFDPKKFI